MFEQLRWHLANLFCVMPALSPWSSPHYMAAVCISPVNWSFVFVVSPQQSVLTVRLRPSQECLISRAGKASKWPVQSYRSFWVDPTIQGFMQDKIIASHTCFGGHMDHDGC